MDKAPDAFRTISEVAEELDVPQHVLRNVEVIGHFADGAERIGRFVHGSGSPLEDRARKPNEHGTRNELLFSSVG